MVAENECRTKLANKGQVSLPFPPACRMPKGCQWFIWMPIVILPRARPENVVARNQVTDVRYGS